MAIICQVRGARARALTRFFAPARHLSPALAFSSQKAHARRRGVSKMAYDVGPIDGGPGQGVQRLLALATHLETVRDQDYDHRTWRRQAPDGSWTMCALGHGVTALPDLIGLRWRGPDSLDVVRLDGSGLTENVLDLAAEAFEITREEAERIFGLGLYTVEFYGRAGAFGLKPACVAAAIRAFACAKMETTRIAA
jgi:hypothetical protein